MTFFSPLFSSLPQTEDYGNPWMTSLLVVSFALIIGSILLSRWRKNTPNVVTKKLSKTWPAASCIFGLAALIMVVSRAESIQFLSMPFLWILWLVLGSLFVYLQRRVFKARHYEVLPHESVVDPREKYLPKRKK